jgi:hypothetical protein
VGNFFEKKGEIQTMFFNGKCGFQAFFCNFAKNNELKKKTPIIYLYKISLCFHYWQSIHPHMNDE